MINTRSKICEILAIVLVSAGILLIFIAIVIPPFGEIHSTVLWALGQMFALGGSLLGIKEHYDSKLTRVKDEIKEELKDK